MKFKTFSILLAVIPIVMSNLAKESSKTKRMWLLLQAKSETTQINIKCSSWRLQRVYFFLRQPQWDSNSILQNQDGSIDFNQVPFRFVDVPSEIVSGYQYKIQFYLWKEDSIGQIEDRRNLWSLSFKIG